MTDQQRATVRKLFAQNPVTECTEGDHYSAAERGKEGPGSKYLAPEEFESIRELGVRLGTSEPLLPPNATFAYTV